MSRDDIIRMAREAGIQIENDWAGRPSTLVVKDGGTYLRGMDAIERFAARVAAAERNAILQMSREQWFKTQADFEGAIRARESK